MSQKEETSALTRTLSSFEDLLAVQLWTETLFKHLQAYFICFKEFAKLV